MELYTLFVWFVLYSALGWLYETTFCTIQNRHWCNRGFLISPCCPIYGAGAVLDVLICSRLPNPLAVFVVCVAGSAVLEYVVAWILQRVFNVICWDYSEFPLNLHGRICLPASLCFGVGGLVVLYLLHPMVMLGTAFVPDAVMQFIALLLMGLLAADTALTAARLTPLDQRLSRGQNAIDTRMEQTCRIAVDFLKDLREDE